MLYVRQYYFYLELFNFLVLNWLFNAEPFVLNSLDYNLCNCYYFDDRLNNLYCLYFCRLREKYFSFINIIIPILDLADYLINFRFCIYPFNLYACRLGYLFCCADSNIRLNSN